MAALEVLGVPGQVPLGDPEVQHFIAVHEWLTDDPAGYTEWIEQVAGARLQRASSLCAWRDLTIRLGELRREAGLGAYACGEAMQVCLADLGMLEELERADVPNEAVQAMRSGLLDASVDLVGRLLRNIALRLAQSRGGMATSDPGVRRLAHLQPVGPSTRKIPHDRDRVVLVVATAGRGTRLRTTIPKGLVPVGGIPMVARVVRAAAKAGISQIMFVLKYRAEVQIQYLARFGAVVVQERAEGTGHSAIAALAALPMQRAPMILAYSDAPFLTGLSFERPLAELVASDSELVLATYAPADGESGRVLRNDAGEVTGVVQPRLGSLGGDEGDGGVYAFRRERLFDALGNLVNDNARREYSLTDAVAGIVSTGSRVGAVLGPPEEFQSVNLPSDLLLARLRAATGITPQADWQGEDHQAVLDFFAGCGAGRADFAGAARSADRQEALGAAARCLERAASLVGPVLDLSHPELRPRESGGDR